MIVLSKIFYSKNGRSKSHGIYRLIRNLEPISKITNPVSGEDSYLFSLYQDCLFALNDQRFSSEIPLSIKSVKIRNDVLTINNNMLLSDPPKHNFLRSLFLYYFENLSVSTTKIKLLTIANKLIENIGNEREIDIIEKFAFDFPMIFICDLIGIPVEDRHLLRGWLREIAFGKNIDRIRAAKDFSNYVNSLFKNKTDIPEDSFIYYIMNLTRESIRLTHSDLVGMIYILLVAGHENTQGLIGNGLLALFEHNKIDEAKKHFDSTAVNELIRFNGPVENLPRWTTEDLQIDHIAIPKESQIIIGIQSANRDENRFLDPSLLNLKRGHNQHLGFGSGIHYCPGAKLGILETEIAINLLLKNFPSIKLKTNSENAKWEPSIFIKSLESLEVLTK